MALNVTLYWLPTSNHSSKTHSVSRLQEIHSLLSMPHHQTAKMTGAMTGDQFLCHVCTAGARWAFPAEPEGLERESGGGERERSQHVITS